MLHHVLHTTPLNMIQTQFRSFSVPQKVVCKCKCGTSIMRTCRMSLTLQRLRSSLQKMPPRIQREDTATRVVGAVVTIVEYIPRIYSFFVCGVVSFCQFLMTSMFHLARGGAEVVGIAFMCLCATMLFVMYYDPATKIACFVKPHLCAVNATDMFGL